MHDHPHLFAKSLSNPIRPTRGPVAQAQASTPWSRSWAISIRISQARSEANPLRIHIDPHDLHNASKFYRKSVFDTPIDPEESPARISSSTDIRLT